MGAIAGAITAYAQPLLDNTDGSIEQLNSAFALGQLCWNLAILPEEERNEALRDMRPGLKMGAGEFEDFQRTVLMPMIRRHEEMFPRMHGLGTTGPSRGISAAPSTPSVSTGKYPGTARNAPCPCNSGTKYKKCCGR